MASFDHLLMPGRIGTLELKNRMVVSAMGVNLAETDGTCGDRIRAYHEEQAKGGAGLITLGVSGVAWPHGGNLPRQVAISEDRHIPGLKALANAVHKHGSKIATQLHFGGMVAVEDMKAGREAWIPSYPDYKVPDLESMHLVEELERSATSQKMDIKLKVMDHEDIATLTQKFADAAVRAREAGLDGLELHGGHGYILSSFLSPATNNRDDEYGGSLQNRARFLLDVIAAVRKAVGNDFPFWVKLDSEEIGQTEGISLSDAIETGKLAQAAGVDAVTVSAYHDSSRGALHCESNIPHTPERLVANATAFKHALSIPVIAVGRVEPESANKHIQQGHFDFLGMGRKLLADPHLPRKLADNRAADVRPCIYCYCCVSQIYVESPIKCAVNADLGFEAEQRLAPAASTKHVVVIGGGPGGMEAARRASLKGYKVTLLEASGTLGGTLQFAGIAYEPNERILNWLRREVNSADITVKLNTTATSANISALKPDLVIVATGAKRDMPPIPGGDKDFVFSGDEMRALVLGESDDALKQKTGRATRLAMKLGAATGISKKGGFVRKASEHWLPLGDNIVVIGGELVGLELAEFLAHRGRKVTVLHDDARPGRGLFIVRRMRLLAELDDLGVVIQRDAAEISIGEHKVTYRNKRGQERSVIADHVIVAKGATGDESLADALRDQGLNVEALGDCTGVSYIDGAIHSAADIIAKT